MFQVTWNLSIPRFLRFFLKLAIFHGKPNLFFKKSVFCSAFCFAFLPFFSPFTLERRWSSRTFRYGYLVTTSPQSWIPPWQTPSLRLGCPLLVKPTPMVWRAVCTRPGNVFTATCWSAITSDSDFIRSSCRPQSGLRSALKDSLHFTISLPSVPTIVWRVKPYP